MAFTAIPVLKVLVALVVSLGDGEGGPLSPVVCLGMWFSCNRSTCLAILISLMSCCKVAVKVGCGSKWPTAVTAGYSSVGLCIHLYTCLYLAELISCMDG